MTTEDTIVEGDKVVAATSGVGPTPERKSECSFEGFMLSRFEDDKIAVRWANCDASCRDCGSLGNGYTVTAHHKRQAKWRMAP
jgi:hypothetical protein